MENENQELGNETEKTEKKEYCIPLSMTTHGLRQCIKDECKCFWDEQNQTCLINMAFKSFTIRNDWNLRMDIVTKIDKHGNRIPRTEADFIIIREVFNQFKGVFGL